MVWHGMAWHGMAWHGMARHGGVQIHHTTTRAYRLRERPGTSDPAPHRATPRRRGPASTPNHPRPPLPSHRAVSLPEHIVKLLPACLACPPARLPCHSRYLSSSVQCTKCFASLFIMEANHDVKSGINSICLGPGGPGALLSAASSSS